MCPQPQVLWSQGASTGSLMPEKKTCSSHDESIYKLCTECGQEVDPSAVPLTYIVEGLRLSTEKIARVREKEFENLLSRRKLILVLDLDHTLLNSAQLSDIKKEDTFLNSQRDELPDSWKTSLFWLEEVHLMTKLRPYVHTFLEEASELFEMYIYTMGERDYALKMAKLLDPENKYFQSRVISRGDCIQENQKSLDIVLGQESTVVILDDTEAVWEEKNKANLILMDRYHFFASGSNNSLSQRGCDESEKEGSLAIVLKVLRRIHSLFYDERCKDYQSRDVRQVLRTVRKEVLKGCKVIFTGVIPVGWTPQHHSLWIMAERFGATCSVNVDSSVTHVVSMNAGTAKSCWAVKNKKFLVNRGWLEASIFLWRKQPEEKFPVHCAKKR